MNWGAPADETGMNGIIKNSLIVTIMIAYMLFVDTNEAVFQSIHKFFSSKTIPNSTTYDKPNKTKSIVNDGLSQA